MITTVPFKVVLSDNLEGLARVGQFSMPITALSGSLFHADSQLYLPP